MGKLTQYLGSIKDTGRIVNLRGKGIEKEDEHLQYLHKIFPDIKYVVTSNKSKCTDLCDSLGTAIRYWLWYHGVSPRITFFRIKYLWKRRSRKNLQ